MPEHPKPADEVAWDILISSAPNFAVAQDRIEAAVQAGVDFKALLELQTARLDVFQ